MKIICEECGAHYRIPVEKIKQAVSRATCKKCGAKLLIRRDGQNGALHADGLDEDRGEMVNHDERTVIAPVPELNDCQAGGDMMEEALMRMQAGLTPKAGVTMVHRAELEPARPLEVAVPSPEAEPLLDRVSRPASSILAMAPAIEASVSSPREAQSAPVAVSAVSVDSKSAPAAPAPVYSKTTPERRAPPVEFAPAVPVEAVRTEAARVVQVEIDSSVIEAAAEAEQQVARQSRKSGKGESRNGKAQKSARVEAKPEASADSREEKAEAKSEARLEEKAPEKVAEKLEVKAAPKADQRAVSPKGSWKTAPTRDVQAARQAAAQKGGSQSVQNTGKRAPLPQATRGALPRASEMQQMAMADAVASAQDGAALDREKVLMRSLGVLALSLMCVLAFILTSA